VTGFIVTAIAMLIGVVPCGIVMCRGKVMEALVAYEVVSSIAVMVLVLLAVLMLGSGLVFVRALERWL